MSTAELGGLLMLLAATVGLCVVLSGLSAWWKWSPEAHLLRAGWAKLKNIKVTLDD